MTSPFEGSIVPRSNHEVVASLYTLHEHAITIRFAVGDMDPLRATSGRDLDRRYRFPPAICLLFIACSVGVGHSVFFCRRWLQPRMGRKADHSQRLQARLSDGKRNMRNETLSRPRQSPESLALLTAKLKFRRVMDRND